MIDFDVVSFSCGTGTLHRPSFSASSYQRLFLSSDAIAAFLAANSNRRNNDTSNARNGGNNTEREKQYWFFRG